MKRLVLVVVALAVVAGLSVAVDAQVKKGKARSALTKQLMSGLIVPNCAGLGEALKQAPADDKAWSDLAVKAALLNEAGYLLMDDGRCPDADWAAAAKTLREASAEVLAKIEAKDHAAAKTAFEAVTKSCGECHKVHKK